MSCTTAPGASSSTSRMGSRTEPSCTVTLTFTSRTISRAFSSVEFAITKILSWEFSGELDGYAVGVESDGADKFGRAVEQHAGVAENGRLHLDHVANTQVGNFANGEFEPLPLGAATGGLVISGMGIAGACHSARTGTVMRS